MKTNEDTNSSVAFSASALRSTTPLTMLPNTLIGEKPPAVAPLMISNPISTGLIPYVTAKPRPIGAMIATAPGTTAPDAVRTAVTRNITHGIAAVRPPYRSYRGMHEPVHRPVRGRDREQVRDPDQDHEQVAREPGEDVVLGHPERRAHREGGHDSEHPHVDREQRRHQEDGDEDDDGQQLVGHQTPPWSAARTICTGWLASRPTPCAICWRHETPVAATSVAGPSARSAGNSRDSPICMDSS